MLMIKTLYMLGNLFMTLASAVSLGKKAHHFKQSYDKHNYQHYADPNPKRRQRRQK